MTKFEPINLSRLAIAVIVAVLLILHGVLWLVDARQQRADEMRATGATWGAVDSGGHHVQD